MGLYQIADSEYQATAHPAAPPSSVQSRDKDSLKLSGNFIEEQELTETIEDQGADNTEKELLRATGDQSQPPLSQGH